MELQKLVSSIKVLVVSTCAGNPGSLAGIRIVYRAQKRFWNPIRARMMPSRPLSSHSWRHFSELLQKAHIRECVTSSSLTCACQAFRMPMRRQWRLPARPASKHHRCKSKQTHLVGSASMKQETRQMRFLVLRLPLAASTFLISATNSLSIRRPSGPPLVVEGFNVSNARLLGMCLDTASAGSRVLASFVQHPLAQRLRSGLGVSKQLPNHPKTLKPREPSRPQRQKKGREGCAMCKFVGTALLEFFTSGTCGQAKFQESSAKDKGGIQARELTSRLAVPVSLHIRAVGRLSPCHKCAQESSAKDKGGIQARELTSRLAVPVSLHIRAVGRLSPCHKCARN